MFGMSIHATVVDHRNPGAGRRFQLTSAGRVLRHWTVYPNGEVR